MRLLFIVVWLCSVYYRLLCSEPDCYLCFGDLYFALIWPSPYLLHGAQDQWLGEEQDYFPCGSTGTSSCHCQGTNTCMIRACHTSRQPLQNHFSGHLGGWATPRSAKKCWMDNTREWTSLPMQVLLTLAYCRKHWKRISADWSVMSPRRPNRSRDWIELNWTDLLRLTWLSLSIYESVWTVRRHPRADRHWSYDVDGDGDGKDVDDVIRWWWRCWCLDDSEDGDDNMVGVVDWRWSSDDMVAVRSMMTTMIIMICNF